MCVMNCAFAWKGHHNIPEVLRDSLPAMFGEEDPDFEPRLEGKLGDTGMESEASCALDGTSCWALVSERRPSTLREEEMKNMQLQQ